jgi:hypothetical protein
MSLRDTCGKGVCVEASRRKGLPQRVLFDLFFMVLRIEPRSLHILGKYCTTDCSSNTKNLFIQV